MASSEHILTDFMARISREMALEYDRIHSRAAEDPGTAGDEGENNWAELLADWLPATYHIGTKGRVMSSTGELSGQVDLVVLKPSYPRKMLKQKTWLADGVLAAFECKTTLKPNHIAEAFKNAERVKRLCLPRFGSPYRELKSPLIYGLLCHSHTWKGSNSTPFDNLNQLVETAMRDVEQPRYLPDMICVADLATYCATSQARSPVPTFSQIEASGVRNPFLELMAAEYPEGFSVTAGMFAGSKALNGEGFNPIAAFVTHLLLRIGREDPTVRDIANYFSHSPLAKIAGGGMPMWDPREVYTEPVITRLKQGEMVGDIWSEWCTLAV